MYAIVETGGKQYKVKKNDILEVEKLDKAPGKSVKLDKVLLYADSKKIEIGAPYLKNVKVACEIVADTKGKKVISFKYKRRKDSRKTIGHRQKYSKIKVTEIVVA